MVGNNEMVALNDQQPKEYVCLIKDGKFYWANRDNKEVSKNVSGGFVIFAAMDGSGYVKVCTVCKELDLDYMEHLHDELFTITYWGKASTYRE
jgi:hypothetical protein